MKYVRVSDKSDMQMYVTDVNIQSKTQM